jgi:hypothetical protein
VGWDGGWKLGIDKNCLKLIEYLKNKTANCKGNIRQTNYLNFGSKAKR